LSAGLPAEALPDRQAGLAEAGALPCPSVVFDGGGAKAGNKKYAFTGHFYAAPFFPLFAAL